MGRCLGVAALLALALLPALATCAKIRGLDPELAPRYQPSADGKFACLDGMKSIPFEQVNDDYCDCFDGSDEPGTSACPNGHFYCENKYFLPLRLNSSMVDDGVCDCCDGSDEPAGRCQNECYNKGHEGLVALKEKAAAAEKGVAARNKYVQEAAGTKAQWAARKAEVESELGRRRREKEEAEDAKAKLEEEQRKLRDRKRELEDEREKRAAAAAADAQPDEDAAAEEEQVAAEEEQAATAEEQAGDEEQRVAGEEGDAAGKSEEELAKERMAQWIPGAKDDGTGDAGDAAAGDEAAEAEADALPVYDGEDAVEVDAAALEQQEEEEQQFFHDGPAGSDDADPGGDADSGGGDGGAAAAGDAAGGDASAAGAGDAGTQPTSAFGKARLLLTKMFAALTGKRGAPAGDDELSAAIAAVEAELEALNKRLNPARTRATDARTKLNELEAEERKLQGQLEGAYGADDAFVALVGRCFDAQVDKYTYSVCPYDRASQKEGSSSTSLGTWSGLEGGEARLAFRKGQSCWQGPARSMTVTLLCGQTERLAKVEEPSRCEYTAELETPAACTAAAAEALRLEVQARQRLLEGEDEAAPAVPRDEL